MKRFARPVLLLCFVSLLTDIASEMLYPVAPIFLTSVLGASMTLLGIIEGIAEAVAGLSKGFFGGMSDQKGKRTPFVIVGYTLSALAKPLPGIFQSVASVVGSRITDRIGKGIRTAPRDALLAGYSTKENRGAVFGFHRAMDSLGAAIGPTLALLYLAFYPGDYRSLFLLAFIPSAVAVALTFTVKDQPFTPDAPASTWKASLTFWKEAPAGYKKLFFLLTIFAFANSSDVFLIMRSRAVGMSDTSAIGGYIFYNVIFALTSFPAGRLSDRFGRKRVVASGIALYAITYAGFASIHAPWQAWVLFSLYGVYAASTEGVAKAWAADIVPNAARGRAIGLLAGATSIANLIASIVAGILWDGFGAYVPFLVSATVAAAVALAIAKMK